MSARTSDEMICKLGDVIADVFEQMILGNWIDEHGHKVFQNTALIILKDCLSEAIEFRSAKSTAPDMADPTVPDLAHRYITTDTVKYPPFPRTTKTAPDLADRSIGMTVAAINEGGT